MSPALPVTSHLSTARVSAVQGRLVPEEAWAPFLRKAIFLSSQSYRQTTHPPTMSNAIIHLLFQFVSILEIIPKYDCFLNNCKLNASVCCPEKLSAQDFINLIYSFNFIKCVFSVTPLPSSYHVFLLSGSCFHHLPGSSDRSALG